jgi:hypothetical protein
MTSRFALPSPGRKIRYAASAAVAMSWHCAAAIALSRAVLACALLCLAQPCRAQFDWLSGKPQEAARLKNEANALNEKQRYAEALPLVEKSVSLERELYGRRCATFASPTRMFTPMATLERYRCSKRHSGCGRRFWASCIKLRCRS